MKNFEEWKKETLISRIIVLILTIVFISFSFIFNSPWWLVPGILCGIITWNTKTSKKEYDRLINEEENKIQKENELKENEKKNLEEKEKPRKEKYEERINSLDILNKKLETLNDLECWNPNESKRLLNENEHNLSEKLGDSDLHKILKIVNFVSDYSKEIDLVRNSIINEINVNQLKKSLLIDFERNHDSFEVIGEKLSVQSEILEGSNLFKYAKSGVYGCTRTEALIESLIGIGDKLIPSFEIEIKKVQYLEGLCISMMIFGIEGKKLRYFEILESFEKLGALDSTWQKKIEYKLTSIESKLDVIIGEIINLNGKMDDLINNGEQIIKELESLNSNMASSVVIQSLNLYQNYKINKNTQSLKN